MGCSKIFGQRSFLGNNLLKLACIARESTNDGSIDDLERPEVPAMEVGVMSLNLLPEIGGPSVVASQASLLSVSRSCSRCKAKMDKDWMFCGVCGQKSSLKVKRKKQDVAVPLMARAPLSVATTTREVYEEPAQKELTLLPSSVVASLNAVLKGFEDGKFSESQEALQRKEMLVTALEISSAMQIEDAYVKLKHDDKLKQVTGPVFDDPRVSNLPRDADAGTTGLLGPGAGAGSYGFVYGSSMSSESAVPLPAIASTARNKPGTKAAVSKSKRRQGNAKPTRPSEGGGYLDEVGSVVSYYQLHMEREKQLVGLRRVIAVEQERVQMQGASGYDPGLGNEAERRRHHAEYLRMQQSLLGEDEEGEREGVTLHKTTLVHGFIVDGQQMRSNSFLSRGDNSQKAPGRNNGNDDDDDDENGEEGEGEGSDETEERRSEWEQLRALPDAGMYWGSMKQRGRFFLPRDGVDAGYILDAQKDLINAHKARRSQSRSRSRSRSGSPSPSSRSKSQSRTRSRSQSAVSGGDRFDGTASSATLNNGAESDADSHADSDDGAAPLSWQQVLLEADQLRAMESPLIWTNVIRPKVTLGDIEGVTGFLDDRPLSRPLTPEPTSDDEDEKFEKQMQEMERVRAGKAAAAAAQEAAEQEQAAASAAAAAGLTIADGTAELTADGPPNDPRSGDAAGSPSGGHHEEGDDDIHEVDHIDPHAAAERAALLRAEKKARIARARRQLAFDVVFQQSQDQGKPKPKVRKPRKLRPEEMSEDDRRAFELQKALEAADGKEETADDSDEDTIPPEPLPIKTALPSFKAYSIIARLYKHSVSVLKAAVQQAQFRSVDEILPPPRSGKPLPFKRFHKMLAVVNEALLQAPGVDQQARIEYEAFSSKISETRAEAAVKVAQALESLTALHSTYNQRYTKVAQEQSLPNLKERLAKLRDKADEDLYAKGRALQALQAAETVIVQDLRAQEFVCIQTVQKWRPMHAEWLGKARWAQRTLQVVLINCAAKVIQRCAKKKLLFMFWGEPAEPWSDPIADLLKNKKRVVYKDRPW